uniref:Uncharacterized protein n=1 Tax=Aegilops tauschii subsp. strangulata TaxID=200361 RepID=A0A453C9L4_AEGTS
MNKHGRKLVSFLCCLKCGVSFDPCKFLCREDDNDDHHQLPRQDTLLEDEHQRMPNLYEGMPYADLDSAYVVPVCIIPTEMISVTDEVTDLLYLSNIGDELENESQNPDPACFTPVKDVLPPEAMDMMAEASDLPEKSKEVKKARREVNGDPACSTPLPENQEMQRPVNAVENVVCADLDENHPVVEESENGLAVGKPNTALSVEIPDIEEQESLEPSTPEPLREGASEKFVVATPAQNEKRQVTRKRRRGLHNKRKVWVLWDENVILDNELSIVTCLYKLFHLLHCIFLCACMHPSSQFELLYQLKKFVWCK